MTRLINIGLFLAFNICYLEWGSDQSSFLFQIPFTIFAEKKDLLSTLTHPLIIFGFAGQLMLLVSAIRKVPNRIVNLIGWLCLAVIVLLVLLSGLLSFNWRILLSTVPFIVLSVLFFRNRRKKHPVADKVTT
ncbi:MAG: hypothetical protein HY842_07530 [Bacteroidetes bacterium]|nr:hypothetical protein [Bacteroidota bacterium]